MTAIRKTAIQVQSLSEILYRQLRDDILRGNFHSGQVLRQEELAQRYGVSRVPLREAMARLETAGLLVSKAQHGFSVLSLESEEIQEIFALRAIIEEHASKAAALGRTDEDINAVQAILIEMEKVTVSSSESAHEWLELNFAFHERIFSSARLRHVSHIAQILRGMIQPYIHIEITRTQGVQAAELEHRQIYEAFKAGDAENIGRLSRLHCEHTAVRLLNSAAASTNTP